MRAFGTIAAIVVGMSILPSLLLADAKVEEQIVGPAMEQGVTYVVSPRGVRLATIGPKGSRVVVTVDGVEGPPFDTMLQTGGQTFYDANSGIDTRGQAQPVIFTRDGSRYAYCARLGNEAVIILDGKEFARLPINSSLFSWGGLTFSPGGKHFYYVAYDQQKSKKTFFMDGKALPHPPDADPETGIPAAVRFSRDDSRFLYYTLKQEQNNRAMTLVIDGVEAAYPAMKARFSADSKQVISIGTQGPGSLLVDGKPTLPGMDVEAFYVAPAGNRIIAIGNRASPNGSLHFLIVDGKKIDASECLYGIDRVVFSPDGKRYAARCKGQGLGWMIIDGTKSQEYGGIFDEMGFSADSSKFVFCASNAGKSFVIVDNVESKGYENIFTKPVFSQDGKHMAFIAGVNRLNLETVLDGKVVSKLNDAGALAFSPDGSRFAMLAVGMGNGQSNIDGVDQKDFVITNLQFSADSKHVLVQGQRTTDRVNGVFIDGQLVFRQTSRFNRLPRLEGDHTYWTAVEVNAAVQPPRQSVIYVDGKPLGKWNSDINQNFEGMPETWEIGQDGILTTLMATEGGVKRLRITPEASVTLASIVQSAKDADAKALADAEAAKQKAAEDAAKAKADADAARAKAAADAQKAREDAATARAKAAADRAAAQQKARDDAAAARAKAAADRAAAAQKARDDAAAAKARGQ